MPKTSVCVLCYGDYARLARRVIESIRKFCPRSDYELVVGANAVGAETHDYLAAQLSAGGVDHLISSRVNLNKCPMMRRMFERVNSEFVWWFDDDSHVTSPDAWRHWHETARIASGSTVMWGRLSRCTGAGAFTDLEDVVAFVRQASWYRGLPPPSWWPGGKGEFNFRNGSCGDGRWDFIVGGSWLIRTSALRGLDWPDPRLVKLGDDVFLGEAIRQQGWELGAVDPLGVAISTEERRGSPGSCGFPAILAKEPP